MDGMIARFSEQLREALENRNQKQISKATPKKSSTFMLQVLGGSGIGGNFVAELIRKECNVPYLGGERLLQSHITSGENTLAIVSSYSGNTEETLSAFEQLRQSGAKNYYNSFWR